MDHQEQIKTYSTESFRHKFMTETTELSKMLKDGFGTFFITRVEDMLKAIKLPVPPNRATTHICIYLSQGEAIIDISGHHYVLGPHQSVIIPAGSIISFNHRDQNRGYICNFHDDFFKNHPASAKRLYEFEFFNVWGNAKIDLGESTGPFMEQLLSRMLADYQAHGLEHATLLQSYLFSVLTELDLCYHPLHERAEKSQQRIVSQFKQLLHSHLRRMHKVSDYAELIHISPNHLNKVVRQHTGKSPMNWISELLCLEAKVLLHQTELTISEIALELGIADPSYFSRFFKKQTGHTPKQFRKQREMS